MQEAPLRGAGRPGALSRTGATTGCSCESWGRPVPRAPGALRAFLPATADRPTVRLVAGERTTSTFVGDPQPVEIHHRGIWYAGELLGWRHTSDGRVCVRVRCTVDGLRHSTWKDLSELRLPDPARPPRREAFPAAPARPMAGARVEDEDRTRPDIAFAGLSNRPGKPAHVLAPPARPSGVDPASPDPVREPYGQPVPHAEAATRDRPVPYRRSTRPRQSDPWSRDWTDAPLRDERDDRFSTV